MCGNLSFDTSTNIVDVYVNYSAEKSTTDFAPRLIHTVAAWATSWTPPEYQA